jgi:anaerobic magnesium-protoporphyrin IX monomethyl ester cyclase
LRIAIIFPPYTHKKFSENLKAVDEEFCHAPPIILAYIASILKKAGHKVVLIDAQTLKLSKEKTLFLLKSFDPQALAFRLETYHFHDTLDWIRFLKSRLKVPVIVGGINLTLYPRETFSYPEIDYGIIGDAIESLPKLMNALENSEDLSNIEGVIYRNDRAIKINPPSQKLVSFNEYPFPARDLLPNEKYYSFISKIKNFTIMVTSRGCPYKCIFCAISPIPYQERSPANVVNEIEECYYKYNIREIDFFDAVFFLNKKRFFQISEEIKRKDIKIEWSCRSRVDLIDDEILKAASSSGCRQILFGIESSNAEILKGVKKEISLEQVKKTVNLCKNYKVSTLGFFMFGNPGESEESIKKTIRFAKELKLDFAQFCMTIAKPNSELNQILKEKTGIDYWREYILGKTNGKRLPTPWVNLSQEKIERYTKKAYFSFYFRTLYLLRILLNIKSLRELINYIFVCTKMLFSNNYGLKSK